MFNICPSNTKRIYYYYYYYYYYCYYYYKTFFRHAHAYVHQVDHFAAHLIKTLRLVYFVLIADAFHESSDDRSCGYNAVNFRLRIVSGVHSRKGMWPWQIGLHVKLGGGKNISFVPLIQNKTGNIFLYSLDKKRPLVRK